MALNLSNATQIIKLNKMKIIVRNTLVAVLMIAGVSSFAQVRKGEKGKAKMEELSKNLDLSEAQFEKIKVIFKEEKEIRKAERVAKVEMEKLSVEDKRIAIAKQKTQKAEAAKATNAKLKGVLTEEQMTKYLAIKKQKMAKRKELKEEKLEHKPKRENMLQEEPTANG